MGYVEERALGRMISRANDLTKGSVCWFQFDRRAAATSKVELRSHLLEKHSWQVKSEQDEQVSDICEEGIHDIVEFDD